jgi:hypothetical protein
MAVMVKNTKLRTNPKRAELVSRVKPKESHHISKNR